jgi:hypothetical protein
MTTTGAMERIELRRHHDTTDVQRNVILLKGRL